MQSKQNDEKEEPKKKEGKKNLRLIEKSSGCI